jgi:hypothetical protein
MMAAMLETTEAMARTMAKMAPPESFGLVWEVRSDVAVPVAGEAESVVAELVDCIDEWVGAFVFV